jgi:hypothetical protein
MAPLIIAALISAAAAIGGQAMNASAKKKEQGILSGSMNQQARDAQAQMKLATSTKTDPYGNKLIYTPGIGWHYDLTPQQQALNAASRGEQLKSLTQDTTMNRQARERADERARAGETDWYRKLAEARYGEQPSKESSIADYTRLGLLGYERGAREGSNLLAKQALRMNNSSLLPKISRLTNEQLGGRLEEAMLKGKLQGTEAYQKERASNTTDLTNWLRTYSGIAGGAPQATIAQPGSAGGDLSAPDMSSLIQALQNASSGNRSAATSLATSSGSPGFDLGAIGPSLSALSLAIMKNQNPGTEGITDPWQTTVTPEKGWWGESTQGMGPWDIYK